MGGRTPTPNNPPSPTRPPTHVGSWRRSSRPSRTESLSVSWKDRGSGPRGWSVVEARREDPPPVPRTTGSHRQVGGVRRVPRDLKPDWDGDRPRTYRGKGTIPHLQGFSVETQHTRGALWTSVTPATPCHNWDVSCVTAMTVPRPVGSGRVVVRDTRALVQGTGESGSLRSRLARSVRLRAVPRPSR